MIERMLITIIFMTLAIGLYRLLLLVQRRRATMTHLSTGSHQAKLLYFRSDACGACAAQARYLAQLDTPYRALVEPIDVEYDYDMARQYQVMSLPTTILIDDDGQVRHINVGLTPPIKLNQQLTEVYSAHSLN